MAKMKISEAKELIKSLINEGAGRPKTVNTISYKIIREQLKLFLFNMFSGNLPPIMGDSQRREMWAVKRVAAINKMIRDGEAQAKTRGEEFPDEHDTEKMKDTKYIQDITSSTIFSYKVNPLTDDEDTLEAIGIMAEKIGFVPEKPEGTIRKGLAHNWITKILIKLYPKIVKMDSVIGLANIAADNGIWGSYEQAVENLMNDFDTFLNERNGSPVTFKKETTIAGNIIKNPVYFALIRNLLETYYGSVEDGNYEKHILTTAEKNTINKENDSPLLKRQAGSGKPYGLGVKERPYTEEEKEKIRQGKRTEGAPIYGPTDDEVTQASREEMRKWWEKSKMAELRDKIESLNDEEIQNVEADIASSTFDDEDDKKLAQMDDKEKERWKKEREEYRKKLQALQGTKQAPPPDVVNKPKKVMTTVKPSAASGKDWLKEFDK